MKTTILRQGDVLLIRDDGPEPPRGMGKRPPYTALRPIPREGGRIVLAHGELTGHAHAITSKSAELFELDEVDRLLRVVKPVNLKHEEHDTVKLPPGNYRVRIQREYSPEAIRNVAD